MNISGPKLVKTLQKWLSSRDNLPATLVILHDELEAPLGKVRVKRGGPESASLRGHRGLISVLESLRGKGLFPPRGKEGKEAGGLDVLRVGVGIGRPVGREKDDVARYVLTEMEGREVDAVARAAESVVDVLEEEMCRVG
jgi:PTH1 family peptidyl-tRNA hydrolase